MTLFQPGQLTAVGGTTGQPATVQTKHGRRPIGRLLLSIRGVKAEAPSQVVPIEQSQGDRSKKMLPNLPTSISYDGFMTRMTVRRRNFVRHTYPCRSSACTSARRLPTTSGARASPTRTRSSSTCRRCCLPRSMARCTSWLVCGCDRVWWVLSGAGERSDRIIVRASNANTVDEADALWIKGRNQTAVHHGNVGINTDVPTEALSVHGNIKCDVCAALS